MPTNWLLPENIADVLPSEARKIEELRRRMLDLFRTYGYELVMPPMLEYLESLLTGTGHDLNLRTFKLVDQLSGRTMGLRADITPQVARIDAHLLNRAGVTRLCYAGNVLHTRPAGFRATRELIQVGIEIYGHAGLEADLEIQEVMLAALAAAGISNVRLDLCHAAVLEALMHDAPGLRDAEEAVFAALEAKDLPELRQLIAGLESPLREAFLALPTLYGDVSVLARARQVLPKVPAITQALDDLAALAAAQKGAEINIDLADLRGYHYHSGVMFAAYVPGLPNAVARGGRYDKVGQAFGRARPATGFSLDLREVAEISPIEVRSHAIRAPWESDPSLCDAIAALRAAGHIVIQTLPGHVGEQDEFACDRQLVRVNGAWQVEPCHPGA
jgi:ATP phosphoribosyltransferase regulatory subunit